MEGFRTLPALLVLAMIGLPTACARPVDAGQSGPASAHSPSAGPMTPAQLQQRLIAYAGSLKQPLDLSQDSFSSTFGITLIPYEAGVAGGHATRQHLTDDYMFYASVSAERGPTSFANHEVAVFQPGKKELTEDPNAACFWEASRAGTQLQALGFERGIERPFQRGRRQEFWRPIGDGKQVFVVYLLTYATDTPAPQTCVYAVRYSGGNQ